MPVLPIPLKHPQFTLDFSGLAAFLGGDEAVSAMATAHLFEGGKWCGWYNSPGNYTIAKQLGQVANSPLLWDWLFPGQKQIPTVAFGLDGRSGPKYVGSRSGTELQTGHLGYLLTEKAREEEGLKLIQGRETSPCKVAFLQIKPDDVSKSEELHRRPVGILLLAFSFIMIVINLVACVMCALVGDWFCFAIIALGIISGGLTRLVAGRGEFVIKTVKPAQDAPPGDGMLIRDNTVIVLKGAEENVNAITRGTFMVKFDGEPRYHSIGCCSLLLRTQFLLQLLLIPQGSLFGQIMFLLSLGVSWMYNAYVSSLKSERLQTEVLLEWLGKPDMRKFCLGTRTTMAVFACLLVCKGVESPYERIKLGKILQDFIPNDTEVWQQWRDKVIKQIKTPRTTSSKSLKCLELGDDDTSLSEDDKRLLKILLEDAKSAFTGYYENFPNEDQ